MRENEITLKPVEDAGKATMMVPATLRVYESSVEGMVTLLCTREDGGFGEYRESGTRIDVEQAIELHDMLTGFLSKQFSLRGTDAYLGGYEAGYGEGYSDCDEAYENDYDTGYSDGQSENDGSYDEGYAEGYEAGREEIA